MRLRILSFCLCCTFLAVFACEEKQKPKVDRDESIKGKELKSPKAPLPPGGAGGKADPNKPPD